MSTTSFGNTPQATDDYFSYEQTHLTEDTTTLVYLDVMATDLGGKAKVLYSIDDGSSLGGTRPVDLLQADAVGTCNYSALGARIWITADGKIAYDICSIPAETLETAKVDGYIEDTFTYAIRLANGTLSWASATVQIKAVNDAPAVSSAAAQETTEDGAIATLYALANTTDIDGDVLSVVDVPATLPAGVAYDAATKSFSLDPSHEAYQHLAGGQSIDVVIHYGVSDGIITTPASARFTLTGTNDVPTVDAALTESADEDDALFQVNLLAGADDVDADAVLSVDNVSYAVDGGPASATAPAGVSLVGSTLSVTPGDAAFQGLKLGQTQQIVVSYEVQDEHGAAVAQSLTVTITGTNDVPVFTTGTTPRTLREHLINSTHNGFESKSVGVIAATDPDDDSLAYSITSDSSGGAFKINELTGEVLVRDISLLDFEGSGLASDVAGSYYTLRIRASDGIGYAERDVKVYLTNVTNTATDGSANFVDGDLNGNTFQLMNGNDVAFGDGGTDTLTGNNQNDWLFGGAGVDALNGSNGNDVLYGGLGTDTMTGGNDADTFVFGHGWNSGIDSITDFNSGQGDKLLLVNDYAGLFDALTAGPVPASQFSSGAGLTTATSEDVRIIYNTSTGAVYYDADGNGSAFSAVQFAVLEKVGSTNPTLTASDILVGPPPGA